MNIRNLRESYLDITDQPQLKHNKVLYGRIEHQDNTLTRIRTKDGELLTVFTKLIESVFTAGQQIVLKLP